MTELAMLEGGEKWKSWGSDDEREENVWWRSQLGTEHGAGGGMVGLLCQHPDDDLG